MMLRDYAAQSVRMAARRGYTIANTDATSAFSEALSAQGELLAINPDATKYELLDAGYNAIRREQRALWKSQGLTCWGDGYDRNAATYGYPTTHIENVDDMIERVDAQRAVQALWPLLTPVERQTVVTLTDHSCRTAQTILGADRRTLRKRMQHVRALAEPIVVQ
jgi:hypothetical protein